MQLSDSVNNFYSSALHGIELVFKFHNKEEPVSELPFTVTELTLQDFTVQDSEYTKEKFTEIDPQTFSLRLNETIYGKQLFTLSI